MLRFFSKAIFRCLILALYSLLSYVVDLKSVAVLFSVWLAIASGATAATIRVLWLFDKVLKDQ